MSDLTTLLEGARQGNRDAIDRLTGELYGEFREIAHARLRRSSDVTLLDTTSLVHESYLRLIKTGKISVNDRTHFLAYAARVMRSVIVDFVRQRRSERRGSGEEHLTLDTEIAESVCAGEDEIIRLSDALDTLARIDERLVRVVELRYFAGMTEQEIAVALGLNERTVRRDWEKARILLAAALR